ncbi:hypothetical protein J582_0505 [Acinetobacter sp. 1566109]|nr:hypothetical protein J582_0505 [Acinetobacter sp. 1566109]
MSKTLSHIDILIRILHIIIMVAFVGAYFTGESVIKKRSLSFAFINFFN